MKLKISFFVYHSINIFKNHTSFTRIFLYYERTQAFHSIFTSIRKIFPFSQLPYIHSIACMKFKKYTMNMTDQLSSIDDETLFHFIAIASQQPSLACLPCRHSTNAQQPSFTLKTSSTTTMMP